MAHHNANEDEVDDHLAAFEQLSAVMQSAALRVVRTAQALSDEQALATKTEIDGLVTGSNFDDAAVQFVAAAAQVLEAHYAEVRAANP